MSDPYLDFESFKLRTIAPPDDLDAIELIQPGWILQSLISWTDEINARLIKRYKVPFGLDPIAPGEPRTKAPPTVLRWLTAFVTRDVYFKRGSNPSSAQDADAIRGMAERAEAELKEAADSKDGLFELPMRDDLVAGGVTKGGPLHYSETSPWKTFDVQVSEGRQEDSQVVDIRSGI